MKKSLLCLEEYVGNAIALIPPKAYSVVGKKHTKMTTNKAIHRLYVSSTHKCPMKLQKRDIPFFWVLKVQSGIQTQS